MRVRRIDVAGREIALLVVPDRRDLEQRLGARSLSAREREIFEGFRFEKRRRDWLAGRLAAKALLLDHLGRDVEPVSLEVIPESSRRPLAYRVRSDGTPERLTLSISISHRGTAAAAALLDETSGSVGVDLEVMEERSEALAEDSFTASERALLPGLGTFGIAIVWCLKEAALKAVGLGLSVSTTDAEVVELDLEQGRARIVLHGEAGSGLDEPVAHAWLELDDPLITGLAVVPPKIA